jgi:glycosyltransferase involved in cell wall biosynthesis
MNTTPLVSILIPTYNRSKLVGRAIQSACAQTYRNLEIIVGDNCSKDDTAVIVGELAQQDHRVQYIRNERNLGPVRNWRACLEVAQGQFVYLLFSDDYLAQDCIGRHVSVLGNNSDVAFSYSNLQSVYLDGQFHRIDYGTSPKGKYDSEVFIQGELQPGASALRPGVSIDYPVTPACALFRRSDLLRNLRLDFPNALQVDFADLAHTGMGNDLACFVLTALDYLYVYHIDEVLAFSAPDGQNLSTIYGGQENFYHYLALKACLIESSKVKPLMGLKRAWVARNADYLAYLLRTHGARGLSLFQRSAPAISISDILVPTSVHLLQKIYIRLRYRLGLLREAMKKRLRSHNDYLKSLS